jgi:hypothetical protein
MMANPTDYNLPQRQTDIENLARKIWAENKLWMSYSAAYIKACRLLDSIQ